MASIVFSSIADSMISNLTKLHDVDIVSLCQYGIQRKTLWKSILNHAPHIIVYLGHGESNAFTSNTANVTSLDAQWFKGCVVAALCCKSAQMLGPQFINRGVTGFVGFNDDLYLPFSMLNPLWMNDLSDLFSQIISGIINQEEWEVIHAAAMEKRTNIINKIRALPPNSVSESIIQVFEHNMVNMVEFGTTKFVRDSNE